MIGGRVKGCAPRGCFFGGRFELDPSDSAGGRLVGGMGNLRNLRSSFEICVEILGILFGKGDPPIKMIYADWFMDGEFWRRFFKD